MALGHLSVVKLSFIMKPMIPTEKEINIHGSLDEQAAVRLFLGKDLKQAEAMFRDNFMLYQEGLMWMGPKAFCFYVDAAIAYLLGPSADEDSDAVSSFCNVLEFQIQFYRTRISPSYPRLKFAIRRILDDFERFDCDPKTYGDVKLKYEKLLEHL